MTNTVSAVAASSQWLPAKNLDNGCRQFDGHTCRSAKGVLLN